MNIKLLPLCLIATLAACAGAPKRPPLPLAENVDLNRFMGPWRVIAHIPASVEANAYDAIESYALNADGSIATTYTFREGAFDGKPKRFTPKGFVKNRDRAAVWGMQFLWPIKAEYLISYLDAGYTQTIIARSKRDYVWIMARSASIPEADYARLTALLKDWGYDVSRLRKVPQPVLN